MSPWKPSAAHAIRCKISDAYYEARNAGTTMEAAADKAVADVLALGETRYLCDCGQWFYTDGGVNKHHRIPGGTACTFDRHKVLVIPDEEPTP